MERPLVRQTESLAVPPNLKLLAQLTPNSARGKGSIMDVRVEGRGILPDLFDQLTIDTHAAGGEPTGRRDEPDNDGTGYPLSAAVNVRGRGRSDVGNSELEADFALTLIHCEEGLPAPIWITWPRYLSGSGQGSVEWSAVS
jgi:hypothetical protein